MLLCKAAVLEALASAFNRRLVKCINLWIRVKWVTAGTGYMTCYFPACGVYHISDTLDFSFPPVALFYRCICRVGMGGQEGRSVLGQ